MQQEKEGQNKFHGKEMNQMDSLKKIKASISISIAFGLRIETSDMVTRTLQILDNLPPQSNMMLKRTKS